MNVFDEEIGGEKEVFGAPPGTKDRAVVADSRDDAPRQRDSPANLVNECRLSNPGSVLDHTNAI
jgi:hypothetical protein